MDPDKSLITLNILWTNGAHVVVEISSLLPVKEVINLIYLNKKDLLYYPFFLHNGELLDLSLSFAFQNVIDGDSLVVYEHRAMHRQPQENEFDARNVTSLQTKIYSVMLEALALNDRFYNNLEIKQKASMVYQKLLPAATSNTDMGNLSSSSLCNNLNINDTNESYDNNNDVYYSESITPLETDVLMHETMQDDLPSSKPLPPLIEKDEDGPENEDDFYEDEENVPLFGSVEEAGKYFAKHACDWTW